MRSAMIAFLYLFIAWAIHAATINPLTHLIGGGDGFIQGLASKTFATSFCSWNPYVQSGKFVFADVLYQSFYPPSLVILSIFPNTFGFNLFPPHPLRAGGPFMYFYLGSLRLTNFSAFVGGLVFMVCGFMTAHKCHEYILCAAVWLPLNPALHSSVRRAAPDSRSRLCGGARCALHSRRVSPDHALLHASGNRLYSFLHCRFTVLARLESKARSHLLSRSLWSWESAVCSVACRCSPLLNRCLILRANESPMGCSPLTIFRRGSFLRF